jgi:hypothetical protein
MAVLPTYPARRARMLMLATNVAEPGFSACHRRVFRRSLISGLCWSPRSMELMGNRPVWNSFDDDDLSTGVDYPPQEVQFLS